MKTLYLAIIVMMGFSLFLLFYFLFPFVEIDLWCHNKESPHSLSQGYFGMTLKVDVFTYTMFLMNGRQLEHDNEICTPDMPDTYGK